jgi:hypothetical protein
VDRSRAEMRNDGRGYVLAGRACHRADGPACALRGRQVADRSRAPQGTAGRAERGEAAEANRRGGDGRPGATGMGC